MLRREFKDGRIIDITGRPWYALPRPWPWHFCRADTVVLINRPLMMTGVVLRCRCGGYIKLTTTEGGQDWKWRGRNARLYRKEVQRVFPLENGDRRE